MAVSQKFGGDESVFHVEQCAPPRISKESLSAPQT